MDTEQSSIDIVLNNCEVMLDSITQLNPIFVGMVIQRHEEICTHMFSRDIETSYNINPHDEFYDVAYGVLCRALKACQVTSKVVPPLVPALSAPERHKMLSVIRCTAWLINISNKKEAGFFTVLTKVDRLSATGTGTSISQRTKVNKREAMEYINEAVNDYPMAIDSEYEDFVKVALTPLPLWWDGSMDSLAERRFNKTWSKHYD